MGAKGEETQQRPAPFLRKEEGGGAEMAAWEGGLFLAFLLLFSRDSRGRSALPPVEGGGVVLMDAPIGVGTVQVEIKGGNRDGDALLLEREPERRDREEQKRAKIAKE